MDEDEAQNTGNKGSRFGWLVVGIIGVLDLGKIMLFMFYFFSEEVSKYWQKNLSRVPFRVL